MENKPVYSQASLAGKVSTELKNVELLVTKYRFISGYMKSNAENGLISDEYIAEIDKLQLFLCSVKSDIPELSKNILNDTLKEQYHEKLKQIAKDAKYWMDKLAVLYQKYFAVPLENAYATFDEVKGYHSRLSQQLKKLAEFANVSSDLSRLKENLSVQSTQGVAPVKENIAGDKAVQNKQAELTTHTQPEKKPVDKPSKETKKKPTDLTSKKANNNQFIFAGFIITAILLIVYILLNKNNTSKLSSLLLYLMTVSFAVGISALLSKFIPSRSFGSISGTEEKVKFKFTGPIVGFILVLVGWYFISKIDSSNSQPEQRTLSVILTGDNSIRLTSGTVKLTISEFPIASVQVNADGEAIFSNIPKEKLKQKIGIYATSPGCKPLTVDSIVNNLPDIKLIMKSNGTVKLSGRIKDAGEAPIENALIKINNTTDSTSSTSDGSYTMRFKNQSENDDIKIYVSKMKYETKSVIVSINDATIIKDITLQKAANNTDVAIKHPDSDHKTTSPGTKPKVGLYYNGGIVIFLEKDGKHGLIAAEVEQSVDVAWWIRSSDITRNSYSVKDGYSNSNNIIAEQGNTGAYAAKLCRDYDAGGYKDWFLPSIEQLELMYDKRHLLLNLKPVKYWSSTANGNNVWFLNFSTKEKSVDAPSVRCAVRAIRAF